MEQSYSCTCLRMLGWTVKNSLLCGSMEFFLSFFPLGFISYLYLLRMARRFYVERCVVPCLLLHRSLFLKQLAPRRVRKWERDVRQRWENVATPEVGVCALDMCSAPWRWGRGFRRVSYCLSDNHLPYGKAHELDNIIPSFEILKDQEPDLSKLICASKDRQMSFLPTIYWAWNNVIRPE